MSETKNTSALIINRRDYREQDSLVTAYSRSFGKINLIARGTQKPQSKLAAHIEPLILVDLMIVSGKGYDYIGSAIMRQAYTSIRENLNKLYYAGQALNIFQRLVRDHQADEGLFFLLTNWLEVLDAFSDATNFSQESGKLLLSFFILRLLQELGYQPEVSNCLICQQAIHSGKNYFDFQGGGVICEDCYLQKLLNISHLNVNQQDTGSQYISEEKVNLLTISYNCIRIIRYLNDAQSASLVKLKINKKLIKELSFLVNKFMEFYS